MLCGCTRRLTNVAVYVLLARLRLWRHLVILSFRSYFWHLIDLQDLKPCSFLLALLSDDVLFTSGQPIQVRGRMRHQLFCKADSAPTQIVAHFHNQAPIPTDTSSPNNIQTDCMAPSRLDDSRNTFHSLTLCLDMIMSMLPCPMLFLH